MIVTNCANKELKGLNYNGIDGLCAQGTIYYDNTMQAMEYDLVVGDGGGTGIHDTNITMIVSFTNRIEWYFNVNDNSHTPVVVVNDHDEDEDESNIHDTINEDSNCKKKDKNSNSDRDGNSHNNIFDSKTKIIS